MRALLTILVAFGLPIAGIALHMQGNALGDALLALWLAIGAITVFHLAYKLGRG